MDKMKHENLLKNVKGDSFPTVILDPALDLEKMSLCLSL